MDEKTVPEFREYSSNHDDEHTAAHGETPLIAQYTDSAGGCVHNEVRGHVSGSVVQIAGNHYGGLSL